jgi:hypothetical protein
MFSENLKNSPMSPVIVFGDDTMFAQKVAYHVAQKEPCQIIGGSSSVLLLS